MQDSLAASVSRNAAWNFVGLSIPVGVSLVCLPILLSQLGNERLGLLVILWALVGYAGLTDLGLPRALTHAAARALGEDRSPLAGPVVVANGLACLLCLGIGVGILMLCSVNFIAGAIDASSEYKGDLITALVISGFLFPLVMMNAGLSGVLEAMNRFGHANACRTIVAVVSLGGATLVSLWSQRIWIGMVTLGVARLLAVLLATRSLCEGGLLRAGSAALVSRLGMIEFVKSARWITLSNVLGVGLAYGDRLILLFFAAAATLAWYVTPYEVLTKMLVVATAVGSAIFPAFSASAGDHMANCRLFVRALRMIAAMILPLAIVCAVVAKSALAIWIDSDFANHSASIARILCIGVVCNAFATVPFAYLQAVGRAQTVAIIHVVEMPLYVAALLWAAGQGVLHVAIVWSGRMLVDLLLLSCFAAARLRATRALMLQSMDRVDA